MEAIVPIVIPATFFVMLVVERLFPGRPLAKVRFWLPKGVVFFVFAGLVNALAPALLAAWIGDGAPLHLAGLGTIAGGVVGALVADFFSYWLHRAMHSSPFLWRWMHQIHHSAERMDLAGMTYTHPSEIVIGFTLSALATYLLGLSADAAALAGLLGFFAAVFQHSNIRTPRWLGWIVYRPEAHGLHHERGVHAYNYAGFPLWDQVFRTFRNPADFPGAYGFYEGASSRLGAMLAGRDVGEPASPVAIARPIEPALISPQS